MFVGVAGNDAKHRLDCHCSAHSSPWSHSTPAWVLPRAQTHIIPIREARLRFHPHCGLGLPPPAQLHQHQPFLTFRLCLWCGSSLSPGTSAPLLPGRTTDSTQSCCLAVGIVTETEIISSIGLLTAGCISNVTSSDWLDQWEMRTGEERRRGSPDILIVTHSSSQVRTNGNTRNEESETEKNILLKLFCYYWREH